VAGSTLSSPLPLRQGVPQGSVLGSILFTIYIGGIREIITKYKFDYMIYADDVQLFQSFFPQDLVTVVQQAEVCMQELKSWFTSLKLTLNAAKTETMLIGASRSLGKCHFPGLVIDGCLVKSKAKVRSLGVILDQQLNMESRV